MWGVLSRDQGRVGSGTYLYLIDPQSYAVSRVGPYAGILGPYAVDGTSRYVVNVKGLGMQVVELSGLVAAASLAEHPTSEPGLLQRPMSARCGRAAARAIRTSFLYGTCAILFPRLTASSVQNSADSS